MKINVRNFFSIENTSYWYVTPTLVVLHTNDAVCMCYLQYGHTPLILASDGGHVECVKLLLDRGAEANQQNKVSSGTFL